MNNVLVLLLGLTVCSAIYDKISVYYEPDKGWQVVNGIFRDAVAWGIFEDKTDITGWGELYIESSPNYSEANQSFAMGYVEGWLTRARIFQAYTVWTESNLPLNSKVKQFVTDQWSWMEKQIAVNPTITYWNHVSYLLAQQTGLSLGYNASISDQNDPSLEIQYLTFDQIYILTNAGDLEDLVPAFSNDSLKSKPAYQFTKNMQCSGLVKFDSDSNELYTGHTTFNDYNYMLRIFKNYHYNFPQSSKALNQRISFSSRPGDLESKDDFYSLFDTKLSVIETSLAVFNKNMYRELYHETVPCWLRAQVANKLSYSAHDWVNYFSLDNSGTHNNEWIITDYKLFKNRTSTELVEGTVYLLDQLPGVIAFDDVTFKLLEKQGYVPSYNIPYIEIMFNLSGYNTHNYSYQNDPRALLFRENQGAVKSIDDMKDIMNSNNWQKDPYSFDDPCNAISARCDLRKEGAYAFGGIDSKVTSLDLTEKAIIVAISGPTHQTQPVFQWSKWPNIPHHGQPDVFNFDWQIFSNPRSV